MSIFDGSGDSLFEMLSKGRETLSGRKPTPTSGSSAATKTPPPTSRNSLQRLDVRRPLEKLLDGILDVDDDPVLVIDDELDPAQAAKEEAEAEESSFKTFALRKDTAVVAGVGLAVLLAIAYFAGRTTTAPGTPGNTAKKPDSPIVAAAPAPQVPEKPPQPTVAKKPDVPAPAPEPPRPEEPARTVKAGVYELQVVSTTEENAKKVADFLNKSARSPLFGRSDVEAYARPANSNGISAVRIRGFEKQDDALLDKIHAMKDPTGGGNFSGATFYKVKK